MDETKITVDKLTVDQVKTFLDTDPEGQKLSQSLTDARVTKGIETWRANNLDKLLSERVEQEISKRYPAETEEQKRLRAVEEKLAASEQARIRAELRARALSEVQTKGLPATLVDHFVGTDEDTTLANLAKLESEWNAALQAAVEKRFADGGRQPVKTSPDDRKTGFTAEEIKRMSHAERMKNMPAIDKALAEGRVKF